MGPCLSTDKRFIVTFIGQKVLLQLCGSSLDMLQQLWVLHDALHLFVYLLFWPLVLVAKSHCVLVHLGSLTNPTEHLRLSLGLVLPVLSPFVTSRALTQEFATSWVTWPRLKFRGPCLQR